MKKAMVAAVLLIILGVAGIYAWRMMGPPPADLDLARSKQSAAGLYTVTIAPESEPVKQGPLHAWVVTVAAPDGKPVTDATITVDGGMPQHGHGLPTTPEVKGHDGDGRYRIDGVRFNMGGWWVLKLSIASPAGNDVADFNIRL